MSVRSLLTAALLSASVVAVAQPAYAAAPPVKITKIYYDSPGSPDNGGNASLNGEYVQIRNMTKKAVNLAGWTIRDATRRRDHIYTFGKFVLKPGKTVTLRTGRGKNTSTTLYWGRSGGRLAYIWNQVSDTAYLRNPAGKLIDSCSYNSSRQAYKIC
ncbi:lamin tail domain-containing protein [Nonomuraea sp. NPDC049309]|uniref:lamin tail domain-containing protein n=1 Tax=Nonomuraea sp. NPDC049309 TaxID=3364350 RepID=UPI0037134582